VRRAPWIALLLAVGACGVGGGEGEVTSERLVLRDCAVGQFDLQPNFFFANPHDDTVQILVQRGDLLTEASDGLGIVVRDLSLIRGDDGSAGMLDRDLRVGLPVGVWPPGTPVVYDPDPPKVNMSLYLNDSCDEQNVSIYSVSGTIRFSSLFSGIRTETRPADLLTEAEFDVTFTDPRDLVPGEAPDPATSSRVQGSFRFYFQRGQPAQPFP